MITQEVETFITKALVDYLNFSTRTIPGFAEPERVLELRGPISEASYLEMRDFFFEDPALSGFAIYICFHDQIPGSVEVCQPFNLSEDLRKIVQLFCDRPADQNGDESCLLLSSDLESIFVIENSREDGKAVISYASRAMIG